MSYMHIKNLYKEDDILMFKECFATEKIHGTSAHVSYKLERDNRVMLFPGGTSYESFAKLFNLDDLELRFREQEMPEIVIFGEAYGGKMQGMKETYGPDLKFIAFEVRMGNMWLDVPTAERVCMRMGFPFVYYERGPATVEWLDSQRDAPSVQAYRNLGIKDKPREGIVIRPLIELTKNNGERIICKHKGAAFSETKTPRVPGEKQKILEDVRKIVEEWVTWNRLKHVTQDIPDLNLQHIPLIIEKMKEDVQRESAGEIVESKQLYSEVGRTTALMVKELIRRRLNGVED